MKWTPWKSTVYSHLGKISSYRRYWHCPLDGVVCSIPRGFRLSFETQTYVWTLSTVHCPPSEGIARGPQLQMGFRFSKKSFSTQRMYTSHVQSVFKLPEDVLQQHKCIPKQSLGTCRCQHLSIPPSICKYFSYIQNHERFA